jgi:hypothetical protein
MRNRRAAMFLALVLVATVALRHPSADLRIQLHDPGDLTPHRVQAALDLGVMAVSVLVTWTSHRFG